MQRLRIRFSRGEAIKFISHLDIMRLWERALRRAQMPLAYSEGFSPHPRISLAAPLPVGVTSEAELMDIFVAKMVSPHWFTSGISRQLPLGIEVLGVYQVAPTMPSLQSLVRYSEYRVEVESERETKEIESAIASLLSLEHLPWHHRRDTGQRDYDLRALIDDLRLVDWRPPYCAIEMRLRCDSSGSGRPEQVALALGFTGYPKSIHRTKLILEP
ncbi:MAG: TIGR03936 family radical SAM-associated protein [Chloroflexota bacterium]